MARGHIRPARSQEGREGKAWTIHYRDGAGKQHQETVRGTKRQAQQALTQRLREVDTGTHGGAGGLTVADYLARWLEECAALNLEPQSYDAYAYSARAWSKAIGTIRLDRLTPLDVQGGIQKAVEAGLAPATIKRHRTVIRAALGQALEWGLISRNPADRIAVPKVRATRATALTAEEALKVLKAARGHPRGMLVILAVGLGLRSGEAQALRWSDLDTRGPQWAARVERSLQRNNAVKLTKTDRARVVSVPAFVRLALEEERARLEEIRREAYPGFNPQGLLVYGQRGQPAYGHSTKLMSTLCAQAGVRYVRLHDLRHTYATLLLEQGEDVKAVSEQLGHASAKITWDIYYHVVPAGRQKLADRIEKTLGGRL